MTRLDELRAQEAAEHARASALLRMLPTDPETLVAMDGAELYAALCDTEMIAKAMHESVKRSLALCAEIERIEALQP